MKPAGMEVQGLSPTQSFPPRNADDTTYMKLVRPTNSSEQLSIKRLWINGRGNSGRTTMAMRRAHQVQKR